jgi:hypothetical protein
VAATVEESEALPQRVIEVEESGTLPLLVTAATVEEGRAAVETAAPKRYQSHQSGLAWVVLTW